MKSKIVFLWLCSLGCAGCYVPWSNTTGPVVVGVAQKGDKLMVRTCKIWADSDVGIKLLECQTKEASKVEDK